MSEEGGAPGSREDRRVRRTKRMLREALVGLVVEKGYDRVTVQDVLDRADLSRATFYAHYRDKDDLLVGSLEELADALRAAMASFARPELRERDLVPTRALFEHVAAQRRLYRGLMGSRAGAVLRRHVRQHFTALAQAHFREVSAARGVTPIVPVEVLAQYAGGGLLGLLTWWLESDTPMPADELAALFEHLTVPSIQASLGLPA
jgi:AcrR family transcriptional regulator